MERRYFEEVAAFEPDAIVAMSKAFEEACTALQVFHGDQRGREIVATRIIDLARSGIADAVLLRDRLLLEARGDLAEAHASRGTASSEMRPHWQP